MGLRNYNAVLSKYADLSHLLTSKYTRFNVRLGLTSLRHKSFLAWLLLYLLSLATITFLNFLADVPSFFPRSFEEFLGSYWGSSALFALVLTLALPMFFSSGSTLDDFFTLTADGLLVHNTATMLAVFSCDTPILHDKNDVSFFIENFQPLSIELHPAQKKLFFILFGSQGPVFQNKIKECSNLLNSFFSGVKILRGPHLKKFFLLGLDHFLIGAFSRDVFFSKADVRSALQKNASGIDQSHVDLPDPDFNSNHLKTSNVVFLLSLLGSQDSNTIDPVVQHHFFRGLRLGSEHSSSPSFRFNSPVSTTRAKEFFSALLRLPLKSTTQADQADFVKMYFFILHKFFQYQFTDSDQVSLPVPSDLSLMYTRNNLPVEPSNLTSESLVADTSSPVLPLPSSDDQSLIDELPDQDKHVPKEIFVDLKKISFQFTQFCHLFCPVFWHYSPTN